MNYCLLFCLWLFVAFASGEEIVLGMSAPFEGPTKNLGTELKQGADAFFNKYNAQTHRHKIKLIALDDGYEPVKTEKNTAQFINQDVFALFGYVGTPTTAQVLPLVLKNNAILFAPYTGANFLRSPFKPSIFNVRASYFLEAETQVQYFIDHLKLKNVALFIQADEFGLSASKGFLSSLSVRHIKPAAVVRYKRNTHDISNALATLKKKKPEVIFTVGTYKPVSSLVNKLRKEGINSRVTALSFTGAESLISQLDNFDNVFISTVMPDPHNSELQIVREYQQDIANEKISHESFEGYVNALFFCSVIDEFDHVPTREEFINKAETMTFSHGGISFKYSTTDRQGLSHAYLNMVKDTGLIPVNYLLRY